MSAIEDSINPINVLMSPHANNDLLESLKYNTNVDVWTNDDVDENQVTMVTRSKSFVKRLTEGEPDYLVSAAALTIKLKELMTKYPNLKIDFSDLDADDSPGVEVVFKGYEKQKKENASNTDLLDNNVPMQVTTPSPGDNLKTSSTVLPENNAEMQVTTPSPVDNLNTSSTVLPENNAAMQVTTPSPVDNLNTSSTVLPDDNSSSSALVTPDNRDILPNLNTPSSVPQKVELNTSSTTVPPADSTPEETEDLIKRGDFFDGLREKQIEVFKLLHQGKTPNLSRSNEPGDLKDLAEITRYMRTLKRFRVKFGHLPNLHIGEGVSSEDVSKDMKRLKGLGLDLLNPVGITKGGRLTRHKRYRKTTNRRRNRKGSTRKHRKRTTQRKR